MFSLVFILISAHIDSKKRVKKTLSKKPFVSFIVPSYNDADTLSNTIESIYDSYDKKNMEVFVINDCSSDNTSEVLKILEKQYALNVITNEKNQGKVRSINNAFERTKGEIIAMIDSDVIVNKEAITDMLARMEDEKVGGVSCRYNTLNKGFLPEMQRCEYGMYSLIQRAYNSFSTSSFWGGCMAIKRSVFIKVGLLSENCIVEDGDLALKIEKYGFKAQESHVAIYTFVPSTPKSWFKQRLRWTSGGMQNFLNHFSYFLRHPVAVFFLITNLVTSVLFLIALSNNIVTIHNMYLLFESFIDSGNSIMTSIGLTKIASGYQLLKNLVLYAVYPIFSIPYLNVNFPLRKKPVFLLWIFPFSVIYLPAMTILGILGVFNGTYKTITLKKSDRGW